MRSQHLKDIALSGVYFILKGVFPMKTTTTATAAAGRKSRISTRFLVVTAMLSAVAFVLMFIEFPLPMLIPSFVKLDISDLPALLGSFALGPVYGVVIELLKNLLHILIKGTSSAYIGELFNFLCGSFMCVAAGVIYYLKRSRKGAVIGSLVGCAVMAVLSVPLNYFLVYPAYVVCYGMPMEAIIGMYQAILPSADSLIKCLVIFNLPFTFCKGLIDAILCFVIYKPLSPLMHGRK
jgi:riboflavin transporter